MAVPPRGAKAIIEAVLKTFAGVDYKWIPAKLTNGNSINIRSKQTNLFEYPEATIAL